MVVIISTVKRKEKEKEQRRNHIIDAAQTLFFVKPYDKITIEAIAKKAHLAKGTLYLYFKSKEALYSAVALRGAQILNLMFKKAISRKNTGIEKAFAAGEAYFEFYKQHPNYFRVCLEAEKLSIIHSDDENAKELMKVSYENLEAVLNAVVEGLEDGTIKSGLDPMLTAIFLIQSTRSMIQLPPGFEVLLYQSGVDKDATIKFTLQTLRRSLQSVQSKKEGVGN